MKTLPAQLTPFVRSDAVGALLAETLGHPGREFSLADLGRVTGVSGPVVHREISRLVESGVLGDRYEGRNRLVQANKDHPLFSAMSEIVAATYGPVPALRDALGDMSGVEKAYVYGSWADRRAGHSGAFPNDIDVLVIGTASRRELAEAAGEVGKHVGLPVNITRVAKPNWNSSAPTPFVRTVKSRPLVNVATGEIVA